MEYLVTIHLAILHYSLQCSRRRKAPTVGEIGTADSVYVPETG